MITFAKIQDLCNEIVREFRPQRIILFGSHARGSAREGSDVDLLVVMPHKGRGARKSVDILTKVDPDFDVDLIVRSPRELKRRLSLNDFFLREVVTEGKVLYDAADE